MIDYYIDTVLSDVLYSVEYIAAITGTDPNYILRREFISTYMGGDEGNSNLCRLGNGVYEISFAVHSYSTAEKVFWQRRWLVILDDDLYEIEHGEMNAQYVLYTLFCILVQCGFSPRQAIARLYHRKPSP